MAEKQYDVSYKMRELFERKQQQRAAAKEYYRNLLYNPHRPTDGGAIFDPALHRFTAMSIYHSELYKPTLRNFGMFCLSLLPVIAFSFLIVTTKSKEEEILRSGVVRYTDRRAKHIY